MTRQILNPKQKALELNLDETVYGTLAEIGAGQEVARNFFQAGAAAGTIAKTMSAYDKTYSDYIYGAERHNRYVCESRLYKMLDHEYDLLQERLSEERSASTFFAFSDTVTAINYHKTIKGSGWLGIRFQAEPGEAPNDIVLHVKLLDNSNLLQQQAVGVLGVNLIYGAFRFTHDPNILIQSLIDNVKGRIKVDMIRMTGPVFEKVDNRLLSLMLVKNGLCDVALFNAKGKNVHASEFLYKKYLMIVRGSFRPATKVNMDMLKSSLRQFKKEPDVNPLKTHVISEITLSNLQADGEFDEQDFLDRVEILCALGQTVAISNCDTYAKLLQYFADYKIQKLGIVIGARVLLDIINDKYDQNQNGKLLASFGQMFTQRTKMYVYPIMQEGSEELMTSTNLPIPDNIRFLYQHLTDNGQIEDIEGFDKKLLHIYSKRVLDMIKSGETGWEHSVAPKIATLIKEKSLFNYPIQRMEFEY